MRVKAGRRTQDYRGRSMNRIILIGNGFDLAHGLKTSYKDFIDDYWEGFMNHCISLDRIMISDRYKYDCIELIIPQERLTLSHFLPDAEFPYLPPYKEKISYREFKKLINEYNKQERNKNQKIQFSISNIFLLHLIETCNKNMNWVDIENEYYRFLSYQFDKRKYNGYFYGSIKALNEDFEQIKQKLNDYLLQLIKSNKIHKSRKIQNIIANLFLLKDFSENGKKGFVRFEFSKIQKYDKDHYAPFRNELSPKTIPWVEDNPNATEYFLEYNLLNEKISKQFFDLKPDNSLYLNFNYTNIDELYLKEDGYIDYIHIHGELNTPKNPIIFGYGDEFEENYSKLENLQDNTYLENIKSVKYLETDNYKRMLNFINSDKYQIIILGHSCGNSDRTLLNTLFEHENCVSIKPYYYRYKDKETGDIKDNYSDIVRNITRSFTDKKSMRDKVVNKTYTTWFSED
jgi:hypothetical protein